MAIRISNNLVASRMLQQVQLSRARLFDAQGRVGSGLQIDRPADDPAGVNQLLLMRTSLERGDQYRRNITVTLSDLSVTEDALAQTVEVLQRSVELAMQGANGSISADNRDDIALEVAQLLTESIAIGNRSHSGRYLFAGHQTSTPPFTPDDPSTPTTVAYAGDTGDVRREISEGVTVSSNITGNRGFPEVFDALIQLRDHLTAGDQAAIGADVDTLNDALDGVLALRSEVGATMSRVELSDERLQNEDVMVRSLISQIEEADYAESIVTLQQRETAYEAALGAAGRALSLSLVDFLR